MVQVANSVPFRRSFKVLVILPLTIAGSAITCSAVLVMCLSSLTVLSSALKVSERSYTASSILNAQLLLLGNLRYDTTANSAGGPILEHGFQFIRFDAARLAPMAFTQFCLKYAQECKPQRLVFRGGRLKLTDQRWTELEYVNRTVNSSIVPERNREGLGGEKWLLAPARGDCNDYAVTKRHQLIANGWPARAVLSSEVVTVSGEHHLVAVVRTDSGDWVLDNLTDRIIPWSQRPYQWVRIQTPRNPNYWASVSGRNAG